MLRMECCFILIGVMVVLFIFVLIVFIVVGKMVLVLWLVWEYGFEIVVVDVFMVYWGFDFGIVKLML